MPPCCGDRLRRLQLFVQAFQEGSLPKKLDLLHTISACSARSGGASGMRKHGLSAMAAGALDYGLLARVGKQVHACILFSDYGLDDVVNTALVNMYGKLGILESASAVFDVISVPDVVTWTAIISVYAQQGKAVEALQLRCQMMEESVLPDAVSFLSILVACTCGSSEKECRRNHVQVLSDDHAIDVVIGTALANMYGKLGLLDIAVEVFDAMLAQNVLTWSSLIGSHVQHYRRKEALQIFDDMRERGVLPNAVSFINVVGACVDAEDVCKGKRIHVLSLAAGFELDISLGNSLVNMYGKCGSFESAWSLFEELPGKDLVSYTTMISASISQRMVDKAFEVVNRVFVSGNTLDPIAFASILEACSSLSTCCAAKVAHGFIVECGHDSDMVLLNVLLDLYGKHQSIEEAQNLFNRRLVRDRIAWNSIIGAYAQQGCSAEALQVFRRMLEETIPDKITHTSIMSALTGDHSADSVHCKQIHVEILCTQSEIDTSVGTALISMYGRCGSIQYAERVFQEMRARDLVTWTAFAAISGSLAATQLFDRILLECHIPDQGCCVGFLSTISAGESLSQGKRMHAWLRHTTLGADVTINNALLSLYGKCGSIEDAENMFYNMSDCNAISWNALLSVYNLHDRSCTLLVNQMLCRGYMPDIITWTSSLTSCAKETNLAEGERVHSRISSKQIRTDGVATAALILLYGRCGDLEASRKMFLDLEAPNLVSWSAMIAVYAQHGLAQEALDAFKLMEIENMIPDEATFASILAACSHNGLLVEGCAIFFASRIDNDVASLSADHILCIIDLLGRAGRLDEAESLVNALPPEHMAATYLLALLGSCRYQCDVERGERIALQAFELDSEMPASYVLLSNLYCSL